jgi:hypothetical protein
MIPHIILTFNGGDDTFQTKADVWFILPQCSPKYRMPEMKLRNNLIIA